MASDVEVVSTVQQEYAIKTDLLECENIKFLELDVENEQFGQGFWGWYDESLGEEYPFGFNEEKAETIQTYLYSEEAMSGYWHYVDGKAVIW